MIGGGTGGVADRQSVLLPRSLGFLKGAAYLQVGLSGQSPDFAALVFGDGELLSDVGDMGRASSGKKHGTLVEPLEDGTAARIPQRGVDAAEQAHRPSPPVVDRGDATGVSHSFPMMDAASPVQLPWRRGLLN